MASQAVPMIITMEMLMYTNGHLSCEEISLTDIYGPLIAAIIFGVVTVKQGGSGPGAESSVPPADRGSAGGFRGVPQNRARNSVLGRFGSPSHPRGEQTPG